MKIILILLFLLSNISTKGKLFKPKTKVSKKVVQTAPSKQDKNKLRLVNIILRYRNKVFRLAVSKRRYLLSKYKRLINKERRLQNKLNKYLKKDDESKRKVRHYYKKIHFINSKFFQIKREFGIGKKLSDVKNFLNKFNTRKLKHILNHMGRFYRHIRSMGKRIHGHSKLSKSYWIKRYYRLLKSYKHLSRKFRKFRRNHLNRGIRHHKRKIGVRTAKLLKIIKKSRRSKKSSKPKKSKK